MLKHLAINQYRLDPCAVYVERNRRSTTKLARNTACKNSDHSSDGQKQSHEQPEGTISKISLWRAYRPLGGVLSPSIKKSAELPPTPTPTPPHPPHPHPRRHHHHHHHHHPHPHPHPHQPPTPQKFPPRDDAMHHRPKGMTDLAEANTDVAFLDFS